MGSGYPAHIDNGRIQYVEEHLKEAAGYASDKLRSLGLAKTAYLAGLIHDVGKYTHKFKSYIEAAANGEKVRKGSVCHTFSGCAYMIENYHSGGAMEKLACEVIAYAAGAHHGEFDCISPECESGFDRRLYADRDELCYDEAMDCFFEFCASKDELDRLFTEAAAEITRFYGRITSDGAKMPQVYFMLGLTARLMLSAVVDADRRSTAEFMSGKVNEEKQFGKEYWMSRLDFFNGKISGFKSDSRINAARKHFSDRCCEAAVKKPSGIYRLTLPTGAGKTLAAMRYSLTHAAEHNKKRIIFVIPLLSVLDQNSRVIKDYLPPDTVITEHHSDFLRPEDKDELDRYELLTDTWESPVIVTTLFQLLNTLFSDKMSSVRRFAALADSVIVIDEIQSLPIKTMNMFCTAVNFLSSSCGADIVLSSATQPNFGGIEKCPLRYSSDAETVPYEKEYFEAFRRSEVIDKTVKYGMTIGELAEFSLDTAQAARSLLIICNTKKSASELYGIISKVKGFRVLFLSAAMCMRHRKDVLKLINNELTALRNGSGERLICVATQLVEAGVDFSFESVIRVIAGIDNAAQAAGRCNRSNEYGGICKVYLVNLRPDCENLSMLREIAAAQRCTYALVSDYRNNPAEYDENLLGDSAVSDFYKRFYNDTDIKGQFDYPCSGERLYELLSFNEAHIVRGAAKGKYILNQSFKSAGEMFKVFDENTTDIIVPYNDEAKEIIADLCSCKAEFDYAYLKRLTERAKPYTIRIYQYQRIGLTESGMLYPCADGRALYLNELCYSPETGLMENNIRTI